MIKRLYNAHGILSNAIDRRSNKLPVDSGLQEVFDALEFGDNVYLAISDGAKVEIVRLVEVQTSGNYVVRGQDNTDSVDFAAGSEVRYIVTAAEIRDTTSRVALGLYGQQEIVVEGSKVSYPEPNIVFYGAGYKIGSNGPISIGRQEEPYGCCTGDNSPAPVPSPYLYVSSRPYPIEQIDKMQFTLTADSVNFAGHLIGEIGEIRFTMEILGVDLSGGAVSYSPQDFMSLELEPLNIDLFGGIKQVQEVDSMSFVFIPIAIDLAGGGVNYTNNSDRMIFSLEPLSGTLT